MEALINIVSSIHPNKGFTNSHLLEKSFLDWSKKYLENNSVADYIDKVYDYFRIIESIDLEEINDANKYKKMQRIFKLLDKFQLSCEPEEQKLFGIEDLRMTYYPINPFIYGLMLMFYDIKDSNEIDSKITYITHWLEDVADACDKYYQKNKAKLVKS
jgi:hypothetical protein